MATRNTSSQFQLSPATHCASVYQRRSRTFTIRTLHRHHKYVLPDNQRGLILQKKREFRKIPHVEFDTPHGMAYVTATTTDDLQRAKIQKRNYVKNPTEFKDSYTSITTLTEKLQTNTKFQRWHVIDEECFKEDWMPPKQTVMVGTMTFLCHQVFELSKQVAKLEQIIVKNEDKQNAKKNGNGMRMVGRVGWGTSKTGRQQFLAFVVDCFQTQIVTVPHTL